MPPRHTDGAREYGMNIHLRMHAKQNNAILIVCAIILSPWSTKYLVRIGAGTTKDLLR